MTTLLNAHFDRKIYKELTMKSKANLTVGVVVPTYQASKHLRHCLEPIIQAPCKPRILVIDSSSRDGTMQLAKELGVETMMIPQSEFNHGATREKARKHLNTDIVVFVTQDAYAAKDAICRLIEPIQNGVAAAAYARQLPHDKAGILEAFARHFNYPPQGHVRCIQDVSKYGVYTFFCSNSCAAYLNAAIDAIGGFPSVLLGEDTFAVAGLLKQGHKVAYVAEACVKHSHSFTLRQELQRSFDTGLARQQHRAQIAWGGKDAKRGREYVTALIPHVLRRSPHLLPYTAAHVAAKWIGYRLGSWSVNAPSWIKKTFSSQPHYWKK